MILNSTVGNSKQKKCKHVASAVTLFVCKFVYKSTDLILR